MELHVRLVCDVPNSWMLEYIPQLDAITISQLDVRAGPAHPPGSAGLGIDWDWPLTLPPGFIQPERHSGIAHLIDSGWANT